MILQFPIPWVFLPPSPSSSNFAPANWNPSLTQYLLCSSSVPLFCPTHSTTRYHKYWTYQTLCQPKPIKCIIKLYRDHKTCYPSKSWVFKGCFSFKVRQHGQQRLYLQYKQSMLDPLRNGRCSFIFRTHLVHTISIKNLFLYFRQFSPPYSFLSCTKNHPCNPQ